MTPDGKRTRTLNDPREAVLLQLAGAFDRWAEEEQVAIALGQYEVAQEAHLWGLTIMRAYHGEMDDPRPKGLRR
jgi:hypothetical protein